jgi:beta-glucuronidase
MIPAVVRRITVRLTVAACALAAVAGPAAARADASAPPPAVSLNSAGWEYTADRAHWAPVRLPHVFDPKPDDATFKGMIGWYRVTLRAPAAPAGFSWGVRFEQIRRTATVYLDGARVGGNTDPYAPFTVALPRLSDGRDHELVVRADNRKAKEPREGWWNWGGITRPAQLVPLGGPVTHNAGFLPQRTCDAGGEHCRWAVLVDAVVENRSAASTITPRLNGRVSDPDGARAGAASATSRPLAPGERARVRFRIPVGGDAKLWGPGHPALYAVALDTIAPAGVQQTDRARIGLRTVSVDHGLLELNGRPIELRGASIQEDVDGHGPALTDADVTSIVNQLKSVGANVTRAHYALDERLQRKLDEAGILVWTQAPIYHRDQLLKTPEERDAALATVRAAVLATRNHPSTITHSVANELSVIPDSVPGTRAFLRDARALTLDLNPTLPSSVDTLSYPGFPRQEAYAAFALLGINSYFGWYPGKAGHSTADVKDLAPYLKGMRAMYPGAGLVLTEFGAESTMTGPKTERET